MASSCWGINVVYDTSHATIMLQEVIRCKQGFGSADAVGKDSGHGDEGGHGFDAVPEVLQAEVFVGGVLVVVVVGDGDADGAGAGGALHGVERDGAGGGGGGDGFAAGALDRADNVGGGGGAGGGGRGGGNEVALGADVVDDALLLGFGVDAYDEAEVEIGGGGGRDGVGGVSAGLAGGDAVDVEGRLVEEFEEMLVAAVGVAEGEFLAEHVVVDGSGGEGLLLDGAEGSDAVVEVRDEDTAIGVFHAGE